MQSYNVWSLCLAFAQHNVSKVHPCCSRVEERGVVEQGAALFHYELSRTILPYFKKYFNVIGV